jgi:hypothetical protein
MPVVEDRVSGFIKDKEQKIFGLKVRTEDYLYSFESKRGEPWEPPETIGSAVRFEWEPYEKDGKTKRYITVIQTLAASQDVTPEATSEPSGAVDTGYRTPNQIMACYALESASRIMATVAGTATERTGTALSIAEEMLEWAKKQK